jgi:hypothetical protein
MALNAPAVSKTSKIRSFLSAAKEFQETMSEKRKNSGILTSETSDKLMASQSLSQSTSMALNTSGSISSPAPYHPQFKFEDAATLRTEILKILREYDPLMASDVQNAYSRYRTKLSSKTSDDMLSEDDFIYFQAFRRLPLFILNHTDLAISVVGVTQSRFMRFCEALMPLAAKYNADRIYKSLCRGGREFVEPTDLKNYVEFIKVICF